MSEVAVQASFNSGEWSPHLYARVDVAKYKSGAALLENWFVDYRGGASTRPGTKYIIQAYKSATQVRVISFQASFNVGYCIEIGNGYMRFIYNGSLILNTALAISAATKANPCVITVVGNTYVIGDWIYVTGVVGMAQLNGRFFSVIGVAGNLVTLGDLNGAALNSTGYSTYTSGGTSAKIYTIASPYTSADDLRLIKFAQNNNQMIMCHPNHPPYVLTLVSSTNWTLVPMVIGSTVTAPAAPTISSTLGGGSVHYSYGVTALDSNGQESSMSPAKSLDYYKDIRTVAGSNQIDWTAVQGAVAYNVYESAVSYFGTIPYGVQYGFIGTVKGTTFVDSNIAPDFTETPPVSQNPFVGSGVDTVTITAGGAYTTVPTVAFVGAATITASGIAELVIKGLPVIAAGGAGFAIGDTVQFGYGTVLQVTNVAAGVITAWTVTNHGSITSGSTPANPVAQSGTSGGGTGATATITWEVGSVIILANGSGYLAAPTVTFSTGAATATATISATSNGNPTVPGFFQQRLVLAAPPGAPQSFYLSKPGAYFNFDISVPSRSDDSITGTLVSGQLNSIKSVVSSTAGMLVLSDKASWVINGGQSGAAITPSALVASAQSFIGANDVPPIVANYDILYVQSKGSGVRDLAYNIYYNVFTGTDVSIMASHLFYAKTIVEWAWAEQPFYIVWATRDDGVMLTLTFLKEQEFTGWAHQITDGLYKSVAAVTEATANAGNVDAVYTVVQRDINSHTVQYIERFAERVYSGGIADSWCVDAGLQYIGPSTNSFTGGEHLAGELCTGIADGIQIPDFVMPLNGEFTTPISGTNVLVGKAFTCDLQTLALELGEPSVQGKVKKIPSVDIRVHETVNLKIGNDFNHLTPMKDLIIGNVSSMLTGQQSQVVAGLVTGDAKTFLNPTYTVPGQYCIRQDTPFPATILGVFPNFVQGDTR